MRHWMFRCEDISRKISQSMDKQLPWHQRIAIWFHLMMCRYCQLFRRQMILLREISRFKGLPGSHDASSEKLSDETKEKIKAKLRSLR